MEVDKKIAKIKQKFVKGMKKRKLMKLNEEKKDKMKIKREKFIEK